MTTSSQKTVRLFVILLSLMLLNSHPSHANDLSSDLNINPLIITAPENDGVLNTYSQLVYKELESRTNIKFIIKNLPKQRALVDANTGEYDGVSMRVINLEKEYPNLVRIKQRIFNVQHVLFSHQEKIIQHVNSFQALYDLVPRNDYKVGFLNGSKKAKDELAILKSENKMALSDPLQAFGLLKIGRIDAYLAGPGIANRKLHAQHFLDTAIKEVAVLAKFPLYCYVHKKHQKLLATIESGLMSMSEDGTLKKIRHSLERNLH